MYMKNKVTFVFEVVESNSKRFIPIKAWTVNDAISIMKSNGWNMFKLLWLMCRHSRDGDLGWIVAPVPQGWIGSNPFDGTK